MKKKHNYKYYNNLISQIEKIRKKNNKNWMDILRLAFTHAPNDAKQLMKKINTADDQISNLLKKLLK